MITLEEYSRLVEKVNIAPIPTYLTWVVEDCYKREITIFDCIQELNEAYLDYNED